MAITAIPIRPYASTNPNAGPSVVVRALEDESETFKSGTPVAVNAGGYLVAWPGTGPSSIAEGIAGIAVEAGSNLTTEGTAKTLTYGSVPNESSAVNIPVGAPLNDGKCGVYPATADALFIGSFGNNGSTATPDQANVGVAYGLTIDSGSNYWYVDENKTTSGTNTAVIITGLDPNTSGTSRLVIFKFQQTFVQPLS